MHNDVKGAVPPSMVAAFRQPGNADISNGTAASFPHHRYQELPREAAPLVTAVASEIPPRPGEISRCSAADAEDARWCEGRKDAVQIIDRTGADVGACLLHAAVLLASLVDDLVVPLNDPDGSAIEVVRRAQAMLAFDFFGGQGVARAAAAAVAAPMEATWGAGGHDVDWGCLSWSWSGNARSSCSKEITRSGPRGIA